MSFKAYVHTGKGHYVGSCFAIIAPDLDIAKTRLRLILDGHGLEEEKLNIDEYKIIDGQVLVAINGDY